MTINRVKPSGWAYEDEFTSAEANAIDTALTKALDKTAAGDTLAGRIQLTGAGRIGHSVFSMPDSDTTITVGNGNTVVELPSSISQNRTLTLNASGASTGDVISIFAHPEMSKTVTVTYSGATYEIGNQDSNDGPWASFIWAAGAWRLLQQSRGSQMREVAFTSSGTFTVPRGVTKLLLHGWGGGGGGGNAGNGDLAPANSESRIYSGGGAGGGGALPHWRSVTVTPNSSYAVTIGAGGVQESKDGKSTTFASLATFRGGRGGADGRGASSVNSDRSTVSMPGTPWEMWNSAYNVTALKITDRDASWFAPTSSGGAGGILVEPLPQLLTDARYGVDSATYSGGLPGYASNDLAPTASRAGCGGGGGAGPGGHGGQGGGLNLQPVGLIGEVGYTGFAGAAPVANSGAGGGGGGGACQRSGALGGNGGSGKLTIFYVK